MNSETDVLLEQLIKELNKNIVAGYTSLNNKLDEILRAIQGMKP